MMMSVRGEATSKKNKGKETTTTVAGGAITDRNGKKGPRRAPLFQL